MKKTDELILAVDIGGSKFVVSFMTVQGDILYKKRYVWESLTRTPEMVSSEVVSKSRELFNEYPEYYRRIIAIGMTLPGFADTETGIWIESDFMGVSNYPIGEILQKELNLPVYIENDCKACALAERYFGSGKDCENYLYVTVSNGIGASLFINGELYDGAFQHAGELGLCVMKEGGRLSETGVRGVLEMYASGRGLLENFVELGGPAVIDGETTGGPQISRLAKEGDEIALKTLELEGRYLGKAFALACNILDPQKIIVGGGLSLIFEQYEEVLMKVFRSACSSESVEHISIEPTKLGYFGGVYGAGAVALRSLEKKNTKEKAIARRAGESFAETVKLKGLAEAERQYGIEEKCDDYVYISLNETIEASLVMRRKLYEGSTKNAGKIGLCCTDDDTTAKVHPILNETFQKDGLYESWLAQGGNTELFKESGKPDFDTIVKRAQVNDETAKSVLEKAGCDLGKVLAQAAVVLDPQKIILGGKLAGAYKYLYPAMEKTLKEQTYYHGILPFQIIAGGK